LWNISKAEDASASGIEGGWSRGLRDVDGVVVGRGIAFFASGGAGAAEEGGGSTGARAGRSTGARAGRDTGAKATGAKGTGVGVSN